MPKIASFDSNDKCFLCGSQAFYVSINSKKFRCVEKITQCPGFVKKAEESKQRNMSAEERQAHMKKMSDRGHAALAELNENKIWRERKGNNISLAVRQRGGHQGSNNPNWGKQHSLETRNLLSQRARKRKHSSYENGIKTKILRGFAISKDQKNQWELYKETVYNITAANWKLYSHRFNTHDIQRGRGYELDHKFSIYAGYKQGIDPTIIGHVANLQLITTHNNRSKHIKCSITLEELLLEIAKYQ